MTKPPRVTRGSDFSEIMDTDLGCAIWILLFIILGCIGACLIALTNKVWVWGMGP